MIPVDSLVLGAMSFFTGIGIGFCIDLLIKLVVGAFKK